MGNASRSRQTTMRLRIKDLTDPRAAGVRCYRHAGLNEPEEGCLFGRCYEQTRRAAGLTLARLNVADLGLGLPLCLSL